MVTKNQWFTLQSIMENSAPMINELDYQGGERDCKLNIKYKLRMFQNRECKM